MLIAFFRFLSYFPLPILHGIGASLGWLVYLVSPSYRRRFQENIHQAGHEEHLYKSVSEAGKSMFELPFIWYASPQRVLKTVTIENKEVFEEAIAAHSGAIFLTPHLGCFEVTAQSFASQAPITVLYRPPRKKALQPLIETARLRPNLKLAPANLTGVRNMLKALKKGEAVGLLPDQVPQQGEGVWADFFGRPAYTMTLPFKLHLMTGAPIFLAYAERLSFGRGYILRYSHFAPIEHMSETLEQQALSINLAMEKLIAQCPAQYIWSYNRYKTPAHLNAAANEIKEK
jgi:KDO2-lipid IV(A) lauroyltransferase